jgi:hypothetical protein
VPTFTARIGATSTPATPDSAPANPQLNREVTTGRTPTSRADSPFWLAAWIPSPNHVRRRRRASAPTRTIETKKMAVRW